MSEQETHFNRRRKGSERIVRKSSKDIDYKDSEFLRQFITERGKILPRRITGVSSNYQQTLKYAIKRARYMALLPFVAEE